MKQCFSRLSGPHLIGHCKAEKRCGVNARINNNMESFFDNSNPKQQIASFDLSHHDKATSIFSTLFLEESEFVAKDNEHYRRNFC